MNVILMCEDLRTVIEKLWVAARTCYSSEEQEESIKIAKTKSEEELLKLIHHCIKSGHLSVLEHQHFTFAISGISRALSLQLARHRHLSISQKSQRYCKENQFDYVTPDSIASNMEAYKLFVELMNKDAEIYNKLIELNINQEDARAILPNACATNMTVTMNIRELMHICNERMCNTAQLEIRRLVYKMASEIKTKLPFLAPYLTPKCVKLGYCTESKNRSCGMKPLRGNVIC